jgi:Arc/MetJ-type ribon-helix-helix transcriptional regulator
VKTLTVRLPEKLVAEIESESRARGLAKSDVVRERLQEYRGAPATKRPLTMAEAAADILRGLDAEARKTARLPKQNVAGNVKQLLPGVIRAHKLHR